MTTIREQFEKAFESNNDLHWAGQSGGEFQIALWAAQWFAERCAAELDTPDYYSPRNAGRILEMGKELSEWK